VPISSEEDDDYVWDPNGGDLMVKIGYKVLQDQKNQ